MENAAFTPGICAERTAIYTAVSEGKREFQAIAIVGGALGHKALSVTAPCGVCRQVMREFCENSFEIILARSETDYRITSLGELLPESFGPDFVKEKYDA